MNEFASRRGESWELEEQRQLYEAYINGANFRECAEKLERTVGGIHAMLRRLGLIEKDGRDILPRTEFKPFRIRPKVNFPARPEEIFEGDLAEKIHYTTTIKELFDMGAINLRVYNVLFSYGYKTARDIIDAEDQMFMRHQNFGKHSLKQIHKIKKHLSPNDKPEAFFGAPEERPLIQNDGLREDIDFIATIADTIGRDERTKRILKARFGVCSEQSPLTLQELGTEFNISRERVRQIEQKTLKRLRGYIKRNYAPHSRYIGLLDKENSPAFIEQYGQFYQTGSNDPDILVKLVYIFGKTKSFEDIKSKIKEAINRYFVAIRKQIEPEDTNRLSKRQKFIAEQFLTAIRAAPAREPCDLSQWLKDARKVQASEFSGIFTSKKAGKDVQFESHTELYVLQVLEKMSEVLWFDVQCIQFEYKFKGKSLIYHPDIICKLDSGQVAVIEVKPASTMGLLATFRKAIVANGYCKKNGWHYIILSPSEGTIDNLVKRVGSQEIERKFISEVGERLISDYQGLGWKQIKAFMQEYNLDYRDIASIALRNDLAFIEHPYTCGKLPEGFSWSNIIPSLCATDRSHINQEWERTSKRHN
jgi:hypothetical protein